MIFVIGLWTFLRVSLSYVRSGPNGPNKGRCFKTT